MTSDDNDTLDERLAAREVELVELFLEETKTGAINKKAGNETMSLVTKIVSYRSVLAERKSGDKPAEDEGKGTLRDEISETEQRVRDRLKSIKGGKR